MRKDLIDGGATRRYILYALGEVTLVMIGILLALQVNNWNEQRNSNKLKTVYLEKLSKDIENDLSLFAKLDSLNHDYEMDGYYLLSYLDNKLTEIDSFRLQKTFLSAHRMGGQHSINKSTYNDFLSSGNMKLFTDLEFKELLDQYYNTSPFEGPFMDRIRKTLWYDFFEEIHKFIDPLFQKKLIEERNQIGDKLFFEKVESIETDWKGMQQSKVLKNHLKDVISMRSWIESFYQTDIQRAKALIEYINSDKQL